MNDGWQIKKLGDVADVYDGPHATPTTVDSGPIFLGIGALQDGDINLGETRHVTHQDFIQWTRRVRPQANDVVFSYETRLGQAAIIPDGLECCLGRRMGLLRFNNRIVFPRYFLYQYLSPQFREFLESKTIRGATVDRLSIKDFPSFPILLPPLSEQQRIVALLDGAFAGLATAKANAEQNLQNARALFESHLQSVFSQRGEGWVKTVVQSIAKPGKGKIRTGPFGSQLLHSEFVDEGIAVLGIDNAVANHFQWGKSRFITPEKYQQLERYTVYPGDVLITIMGTCGRCAVVPDDIPLAINTKHICCITLDRGQCLPGYLHIYFLHAPQSQKYLAKYAKGAIMAGLNMGLIQDLPVFLPPLQVQEALIGVADDLRQETHHLTHLYERKLAALEELKKSILHQAFNGEL